MKEKGAGISETSISMALVGLVVMVSVSSFGGDMRSMLTSRVIPTVGGAGAHLGDDSEQSQSSSARSLDDEDRLAYEEMLPALNYDDLLHFQYEEAYSEVSDASYGSSSSGGFSGELLPGHPQFDWNNIDWGQAVVAGIISEPKPYGPNYPGSSYGYQNSSIPAFYAWDEPYPDDPSGSFPFSETDGSHESDS